MLDDSDFLDIGLPLPKFDDDSAFDPVYGHLHYVITPCLDDEQAAQLAVKATERARRDGLIRKLWNVGRERYREF